MGLVSKRPAPTRSAQVSIGAYSECPLPQDPRAALLAQFLPTMTGAGPSSAGVRLAASTDRAHKYFGTDGLPPLRFPLSGSPTVNQPGDLETAIFKNNHP